MSFTPPLRAFGALAVVTAIAACSDARATDATRQDDLTRDLELANATTMSLASARVDSSLLNYLETKPQGEPRPAATIRKGAGSRAVASRTPTVRATPDVDPAAVEEIDETEALAEAPVPELSEPVAVAPRPGPPVVIASGNPAGDYGTGGGGVIFGGAGSGGGVIIRGGGVDGDNCELHTRGGRRGTSRGPIYVPTIPVSTGGARTGRSGGFGGGGAAADTRRAPTTSQPTQTSTPRSRPTTRRGL